MLKYLFELNGVEIKDVSIGVNIIDKFEEPLDEAHLILPITVRGYEYDMRGTLSITIQDDDEEQEKFDFLIIYDSVIATSRYGHYSHTLTVSEYSHKLDNYLVHTLTKTKILKDRTPARFTYHPNESENTNITFDGSIMDAVLQIRGFVQQVEIMSRYFVGDVIAIPQVTQAYVQTGTFNPDYWDSYVRKDVFIRSNMTGTSEVTLSSTATNWTAVKGSWTIEYGYVNALNVEVVLYTFYIEVYEREEISILDLVNLVRDSVSSYGGVESKRYYDETRLFNIDSTLSNKFATIEAPQVFIQKATARQVLNAFFLYINAISRLNYVDNDVDVLTVDEFNQFTGNFAQSDIANFTTSQDVANLGSKGIVWGERLLPNNLDEPTMKTPGEKLQSYVRSKDIQIREDNFVLTLDRALYQPKKLVFIVPRIRVTTPTSAPTSMEFPVRNFTNVELDLTSRLIDREMWVLKAITNDFPSPVLYSPFSANVGMRNNRVENLYWQQGDYELNFSEILGYIFNSTLIINVIKQAICEWIARLPQAPFIDVPANEISTRMIYTVFDENDANLFSSGKWRTYKFDFEYITFDDISFSSERDDLSYLKYYGETRQNQSDKLSNINLLSRKVYGDIQRAGVPTQTFSKYHEKLYNIYPRGGVDSNGNVIVTRKFNLHNNYLLLTYVTTKDHNRLSEFIGIDQLYRWSEIPTSKQVFQRSEVYKDYLYLYPPTETTLVNGITKINGNTAKFVIFATLVNDYAYPFNDGKTKMTVAYVRTDGFLENYPNDETFRYGIVTPVSSFGIKGGFVFSFGFENNQVAGDRIKNAKDGGLISGNYWNDPIRYTDNLGRFNWLWFQISSQFTITDDDWEPTTDDPLNSREYNLPLVRNRMSVFANNFGNTTDQVFMCGSSNEANSTHDPLIIRKDSSQSIKINYEVGVLSKNYMEYVFGQMFFSENHIVKNPNRSYNQVIGTPKYLYLYDDNTKYGKFEDLFIKSGWDSKTLLTTSNTSFNGTTFAFNTGLIDFTGVTSWAIGDNDGNLYIACNDSHNGFKVVKTHFRYDLLEIGNK